MLLFFPQSILLMRITVLCGSRNEESYVLFQPKSFNFSFPSFFSAPQTHMFGIFEGLKALTPSILKSHPVGKDVEEQGSPEGEHCTYRNIPDEI